MFSFCNTSFERLIQIMKPNLWGKKLCFSRRSNEKKAKKKKKKERERERQREADLVKEM